MAENMLKQRNMVYERNCKNLYVYGNDSDFFASFLDTDARRPMSFGLLNPREENSQKMIQNIIQLMVPRARKGEVLCFSVPGKGEGVNGNLVYHEAVLKQFLQSLGYNAKPINEGQAVVFSELQDESFTGIGISFGGGMCNVSVSFMSMPMITFSVPKGGDYIDRNVAEVMGEKQHDEGSPLQGREARPVAPAEGRDDERLPHLLRRPREDPHRPPARGVLAFEPPAEARPPDVSRARGRHRDAEGLP
jgi:hypothetical protein